MHRWSKLFLPTLREAPADAEVASHKFLVRAGYIRQLGAGIYSYLFLGQRSVNKIVGIVRQEMDTIGQEFLLPSLLPRELWEQSGRWTGMGDNMFRLKDRKGADLCLGMTHEEVMTEIARKDLRSYKQLPQIWYQIQTKFRDEPRPKAGLLRVRQFLMKDAYSFDMDADGLDVSYLKHDEVYRRIFSRCGLKFVAVEADSGAMGGSQSQEFMVYTEAGEDLIASCAQCGYAANTEKATSQLPPAEDLAATGDGKPELVHTPGMGAIADVTAFMNVSATQDIKCVAYMAEKRDAAGQSVWLPLAVFLRGDHSVNETKLLGLLRASQLRPMLPEELAIYFQAPGGFLGPVGLSQTADASLLTELQSNPFQPGRKQQFWASANRLKMVVVVDHALEGRNNMICGANRLDYHFRNVTPGRDFNWTATASVRNVSEGEGCPHCNAPLRVAKAVEVGHIFKLGYRYSESMGARVLDPNGKEVTPIMGSYGIGIERILTACVEQNCDDNGFFLPPSIAPYDVVVTVTNVTDAALLSAGEKLAAELEAAGLDVLLDDREERAGVKFKDADLIGIPFRINVGKKVAEGAAELVTRATRASEDVPLAELAKLLQARVRTAALPAGL
ncbi:MAG: proline--tRNA ligase [Acidobacteriaceae bacterium]